MTKVDFTTYQSPFTWRYGSDEMRQIFSELNRRKLWRQIWVALAKSQHKAGLLTKEEFKDIKKNAGKIDIGKSQAIEKEIYHDLMAEIKVFASDAKIGGGKIHLGATSMDIEDNAEVIRITQALEIIEAKLIRLLKSFAKKIEEHKNTVCMGYTHIQPAEPTTLGYRFALYAQDLLKDLQFLRWYKSELKTKGIKGAVGTSASYVKLLEKNKKNAFELESEVMGELSLKDEIISSQTYPRKTDMLLTFVITSIAQSIHKFALDLRIMQSPNFGEWQEPRSEKRVGSSAMPFKKNPDKAEKICSLARYISTLPNIAFSNAAQNILERTLDDSANRRIFIPEGFLATDEIVEETINLVSNLVISKKGIEDNLNKFSPYSGTESVMMEAVKNGANRQEMHEKIRELSMQAWESSDKINPLAQLLKRDKMITSFVNPAQIDNLLDPSSHTGLAKDRCVLMLKVIDKEAK